MNPCTGSQSVHKGVQGLLALRFCQPLEDAFQACLGFVYRRIEVVPSRGAALLVARVCGFRTLAYLGCVVFESRVQKVIRGATGYADDSQELTPLPLGSIQGFVREENLATLKTFFRRSALNGVAAAACPMPTSVAE